VCRCVPGSVCQHKPFSSAVLPLVVGGSPACCLSQSLVGCLIIFVCGLNCGGRLTKSGQHTHNNHNYNGRRPWQLWRLLKFNFYQIKFAGLQVFRAEQSVAGPSGNTSGISGCNWISAMCMYSAFFSRPLFLTAA